MTPRIRSSGADDTPRHVPDDPDNEEAYKHQPMPSCVTAIPLRPPDAPGVTPRDIVASDPSKRRGDNV